MKSQSQSDALARLFGAALPLLLIGSVVMAAGCPAGNKAPPTAQNAEEENSTNETEDAAPHSNVVASPKVQLINGIQAFIADTDEPHIHNRDSNDSSFESPSTNSSEASDEKPETHPSVPLMREIPFIRSPRQENAPLHVTPNIIIVEEEEVPLLGPIDDNRPINPLRGAGVVPATRDEPEDQPADSIKHATPPADPKIDFPVADWPKPRVALVLTGQQNGYFEPCGCTGLANQKGGMARRHTLIKRLVEQGWSVVPLDAGNQVRRYGRQPEIKFQTTIDGLKKMKYEGIALGPADLKLSLGELVAVVAGVDGGESPFVSANVSLLGLTPKFRVIEANGVKIGVTSVLGDEAIRGIQSDEIETSPAAAALQEVLPEMKACHYRIVLAQTSRDEAQALARRFPNDIDFIVLAGAASEPPLKPEAIEGSKARLIEVGAKGMYVGVLGLYENEAMGNGETVRFARIPLSNQFDDSPEMLDLLAAYQNQLEALGLEGLGLKPKPHPSGREFVGSATCGECHTTAHGIWKETPHAQALKAIAFPNERNHIPRHYDPECLSCHVVGWDHQGYFPWKSGYEAMEISALMHGNGCENCHGPGSQHVAAEMGDIEADDDLLARLREQMRLPLEQAERKCMECHDLDNDPHFHEPGAFEKYWEKIKHYGKD